MHGPVNVLADANHTLQVAQQAPVDLPVILKKIKDAEGKQGFTDLQGDLSETDDRAALMARINQLAIITSFALKSSTIEKEVSMKQGGQSIDFTAVLEQSGNGFNHLVDYKQNWKIVFFRKQDVFIYSLEKDVSGSTFLKEWIYARSPNAPSGTCYTWKFLSTPFGWPLTVEQGADNLWALYRNMPISDVHFSDLKQREHISSVVHKLLPKVYFPFHELLVEIPVIQYTTMEGDKRTGVMKADSQGGLSLCAPASVNDYPLLIDPSFLMKTS